MTTDVMKILNVFQHAQVSSVTLESNVYQKVFIVMKKLTVLMAQTKCTVTVRVLHFYRILCNSYLSQNVKNIIIYNYSWDMCLLLICFNMFVIEVTINTMFKMYSNTLCNILQFKLCNSFYIHRPLTRLKPMLQWTILATSDHYVAP